MAPMHLAGLAVILAGLALLIALVTIVISFSDSEHKAIPILFTVSILLFGSACVIADVSKGLTP